VSSDFNSDRTDTEYFYTCSRYDSTCESDKTDDPMGWMIFAILLLTFLSKDFVDGIMMAYEGVTRRDIKGSFAGTCVIFLTISSAMISIIYNQSTGISNSDIIKDAAILLFLNEIDDQFLNILKRIFPSWVESLEAEISFANEVSSARLSDADESSQSSTTSTKRDLALEVNGSQINVRSPSEANDATSLELQSKINEIQQRIDELQMEVNRLTSESLGAVVINETRQLSRPGTNNPDAVMSKIMGIQQEINRLRREINGVVIKLEGHLDMHDIGQNVRGRHGEF